MDKTKSELMPKGLDIKWRLKRKIVNLVARNELHKSPLTFAADGLLTSAILPWQNDERFNKILEKSRQEFRHPIYHEWRLYISMKLISLIQSRAARQGCNASYIEFGVGEGHTLYISKEYLRESFNCRAIWLFDTFTGLEESQLTEFEKDNKSRDRIGCPYQGSSRDVIMRRFSELDSLRVVAGRVPDSLIEYEGEEIRNAFVHVDMNSIVAEESVIEWLGEKRIADSIILFDDYTIAGSDEHHDRIDASCTRVFGITPIGLPTGQGLLFI